MAPKIDPNEIKVIIQPRCIGTLALFRHADTLAQIRHAATYSTMAS